MAEAKKTTKTGGTQAAKSAPKKLLANGLDPSIGKATQFKPGQSGNPEGPKPGYKHLSTHIQDLLNDEGFETWLPDVREGFKEYKGAPIKAIVRTAMIKAMTGDMKSADWLAKYGYGTKVEVDVTSQGESINPYARLTTEELRKLASGK